MESQLQQIATPHGFSREAPPSSGLNPHPHQIAGHQAKQVAMLIQPSRHRLQLVTDLVRGEKDRICWLGRCVLGALSAPAVAGFGGSGMIQRN